MQQLFHLASILLTSENLLSCEAAWFCGFYELLSYTAEFVLKYKHECKVMASNIILIFAVLKGAYSVCARDHQEARWSKRQKELGIKSRCDMGRAVLSFMMHLGRVGRDRVHRLSQTRQNDEPSPRWAQGNPQEGRKDNLQCRCKVYPGNPQIRTSGGRSELRNTYSLTQGSSSFAGVTLNKILCPWAKGVDASSRCHFYLLYCTKELKQFSLNQLFL